MRDAAAIEALVIALKDANAERARTGRVRARPDRRSARHRRPDASRSRTPTPQCASRRRSRSVKSGNNTSAARRLAMQPPGAGCVRWCCFSSRRVVMSPVAVFVRTLLKSSAIFIGATAIFLHPPLEWRRPRRPAERRTRRAGQGGREGAVDGLIAALKDTDAGVRRAGGRARSRDEQPRAVPALVGGDEGRRRRTCAPSSSARSASWATRARCRRCAMRSRTTSVAVRARAASALGRDRRSRRRSTR